MAQEQPLLPRKCKLKLIQPAMKCSGRDEVVCYYRGKILVEEETYFIIKFKYSGVEVQELYNKKLGFVLNEELQDIKLVDQCD